MFTVPMSETGEGMWAELEGRKKEETSKIVRSGYGITVHMKLQRWSLQQRLMQARLVSRRSLAVVTGVPEEEVLVRVGGCHDGECVTWGRVPVTG
jgi:hypothetical protein